MNKKRINNIFFNQFNSELQGYDCFIKGSYVPRFIVFYKGIDVVEIFRGNTNVELRERKPFKRIKE